MKSGGREARAADPRFHMELAVLRRITAGDPQAPCTAEEHQFTAVDLTRPSPALSRRSEFRNAGVWKRIRVADVAGSFCALKDADEMSEDEGAEVDDEGGREREGGAALEVGADPVEVLGHALVQQIFGFLDYRTLGACLAVSPAWNQCLQQNFLWDKVCKQVWEGRDHHVSSALLHPAIPRLRAFQISMADAQRVCIEPRDLCRWVWEFHFKESIREYWRRLDPHYHGLPPMRRIFHEDGHITAEPMDQIWGGHECSWTIRRSKRGASFVRVNHWPPLAASRTPDWGWRLENQWVVYTSTHISRF